LASTNNWLNEPWTQRIAKASFNHEPTASRLKLACSLNQLLVMVCSMVSEEDDNEGDEETTALNDVKCLLDAGASVGATWRNCSASALSMACRHGDVASTQCLLSSCSAANAAAAVTLVLQPSQSTALHAAAAAAKNSVQLCTLLLEASASLDARDAEGETPLARAALAGNVSAVKLLIARGATVLTANRQGWPLLASVLATVNVKTKKETVLMLLDAKASPDVRFCGNMTPLMICAESDDNTGGVDVLRELLCRSTASFVDVATKGSLPYAPDGATALGFAASEGNVAKARLLLEHKASPIAPVVSIALKMGHIALARMLIVEYKGIYQSNGDSSGCELHVATLCGDATWAARLLKGNVENKKSTITAMKNVDGLMALELCASLGSDAQRFAVGELLLAADNAVPATEAALDCRIRRDTSVLALAAASGNAQLLSAVLREHDKMQHALLAPGETNHNRKIIDTPHDSMTPLLRAVQHARFGCVAALLKRSASTAIERETDSASALMLACGKQHTEAVSLRLVKMLHNNGGAPASLGAHAAKRAAACTAFASVRALLRRLK
jgi:ankyrin repeat protein